MSFKILVLSDGFAPSLLAMAAYLGEHCGYAEAAEKIRKGEIQIAFNRNRLGEDLQDRNPALEAVRNLSAGDFFVWIGSSIRTMDFMATEQLFGALGKDHTFIVFEKHQPERWQELFRTCGFVSPIHVCAHPDFSHSVARLIVNHFVSFRTPISDRTRLLVDAADWLINPQAFISNQARDIAMQTMTVHFFNDDKTMRLMTLLHLLGDEEASASFSTRVEHSTRSVPDHDQDHDGGMADFFEDQAELDRYYQEKDQAQEPLDERPDDRLED